MSKLTLTLRLDQETSRPKYPQYGYRSDVEMVSETETLCDIQDQHLSKGMLAAALRQLADEVDPKGSPF